MGNKEEMGDDDKKEKGLAVHKIKKEEVEVGMRLVELPKGAKEGMRLIEIPKTEASHKNKSDSATGGIKGYIEKTSDDSDDDIEGEEWVLIRKIKVEKMQEDVIGYGKEELKKMVDELERMTTVGENLMKKFTEEMEMLRQEIRKEEEDTDSSEDYIGMGEKIENLERRLMRLEVKLEEGIKEEGITKQNTGSGNKRWDDGVMEMIKDIEKKLEMRERDDRRNNIVIRKLEGNGEIRKRVEKLMQEIKAEVVIEWVRKIKGKEWGAGETVVVRLGSREQKRQVMEKKKVLRGRIVRVEDDLTWVQRKIKWTIEEIAREERRKGNLVWVGNGRIRINGSWWRWDEDEGRLKIF